MTGIVDRLLVELRRRNVRIWAEDGQVHYDAPDGAFDGRVSALVRQYRAQLLDRLEGGDAPARAEDGLWLRRLTPDEGGTVVVVVPPAGAGPSAFRHWRTETPPGLEIVVVHLPGREERIKERPYTEVGPLADRLAEVIQRGTDRPFVLFGHSAGALVAREVARRVGDALRLLVVAASAPPDLAEEGPDTDEELIDALVEWGATPREILASPEARSIILPCLRADLAVVASCRKALTDKEKLGIPIVTFAGAEDESVAPRDCASWAAWTTAGCESHIVAGDHFFPVQSGRQILDVIADLSRRAG